MENAADLSGHLGGIQTLGKRLDARGKPGQRRFDAAIELVVHGLLLAAPVGRAAQDRRLARLRPARQLDLDALPDRTPAIGGRQFGGERA